MILTSLLAFNQQRGTMSNYSHMVGNEIEMAASGAAMTVLELIGSRSFDERTTPEGIHATETLPVDASSLSPFGQFGTHDRGNAGCNLMEPFQTPDCDDIDDVDGIQDQTISVTLSSGETIDFIISIEVDYVALDNMDVGTGTRSWNKRVAVRAVNQFLPYGEIVMERVFAYDPLKAEADYEDLYGPLGA